MYVKHDDGNTRILWDEDRIPQKQGNFFSFAVLSVTYL